MEIHTGNYMLCMYIVYRSASCTTDILGGRIQKQGSEQGRRDVSFACRRSPTPPTPPQPPSHLQLVHVSLQVREPATSTLLLSTNHIIVIMSTIPPAPRPLGIRRVGAAAVSCLTIETCTHAFVVL